MRDWIILRLACISLSNTVALLTLLCFFLTFLHLYIVFLPPRAGGMSDNPRPITYRSAYTAVLADRPLAVDVTASAHETSPLPSVSSTSSSSVAAAAVDIFTVAGKHCESGDVLLPRAPLPADVHAGEVRSTHSLYIYAAQHLVCFNS